MIMMFLTAALLIALVGLVIEIGVTSWSIRRANRYRRSASAAERTSERAISKRQDVEKRMESLDDYASNISWLLGFLYSRYNKFVDMETEVQEGLKDVSGDKPVGELDTKYKDLEKALKIIRTTVKAFDSIESLMNSVTSQVDQIMGDFQDDDESPEPSASGKPAECEDAETKAKEEDILPPF
jgi:hypothetical protein